LEEARKGRRRFLRSKEILLFPEASRRGGKTTLGRADTKKNYKKNVALTDAKKEETEKPPASTSG